MSGIDENGNPIHYEGFFQSGAHLNPETMKDALNNVSDSGFFANYQPQYETKNKWFTIGNLGVALILGGIILLVFLVVFGF